MELRRWNPYIVDLGIIKDGRPSLEPGEGGIIVPVIDEQPSTGIAYSFSPRLNMGISSRSYPEQKRRHRLGKRFHLLTVLAIRRGRKIPLRGNCLARVALEVIVKEAKDRRVPTRRSLPFTRTNAKILNAAC